MTAIVCHGAPFEAMWRAFWQEPAPCGCGATLAGCNRIGECEHAICWCDFVWECDWVQGDVARFGQVPSMTRARALLLALAMLGGCGTMTPDSVSFTTQAPPPTMPTPVAPFVDCAAACNRVQPGTGWGYRNFACSGSLVVGGALCRCDCR